jgi:hypothetical protein
MPTKEIIITYQGNICTGRGIEEIINILPYSTNGKNVVLHLRGPIDSKFHVKLMSMIRRKDKEDHIKLHPIAPHHFLPELTARGHIGLAVYTEDEVLISTLGTSSNKVYEYSACGLPFIYFGNEHFKQHYEDMPWGVSTDLSKSSIEDAIMFIMENYMYLSSAARASFLSERNFEKAIAPAVEYVKTLLDR